MSIENLSNVGNLWQIILQLGISGWPSVQQYVYFLFCPSFIYRDEYPRSQTRCLKKASVHFLHCFILIEFVNLQFTQYVYPWLDSLEYSSLSPTKTVISIFAGIVPGALCLICLFYGLLHSWLNGFAELMRFGDRQFYLIFLILWLFICTQHAQDCDRYHYLLIFKDNFLCEEKMERNNSTFEKLFKNWWNVNNMAEYYRNWNLVVHDWLYAYIYRDVSKFIGGHRGLQIAQTSVFFLSAAFHEYWFGVAFRVFYPVMFILYFVFGGIFFSVSKLIKNKSVWNTALWFNLLIGTGMFTTFYGLEWYARQRCAPYKNRIADFLLPRHWTCERM